MKSIIAPFATNILKGLMPVSWSSFLEAERKEIDKQIEGKKMIGDVMKNWKLLKDQDRKRLYLENEFGDIWSRGRSDEKRMMERIVDCEFYKFFHNCIFGIGSGHISLASLAKVIKEHDDIFAYSALVGESYSLFQSLTEWAYENKITGKRLFFFRNEQSLDHAFYEYLYGYDLNDPETVEFLEERKDIRCFKEVFANNQLFFLDTYDGSMPQPNGKVANG
jgi:hypothetical protein